VTTLDVSRDFIGADIESCGSDFVHLLADEIQKNWMYPISKPVSVQYSSLGAKAVAFGAAGMLIHRIFATNKFPVPSD
jgi:hypothetical protein